MTYPPLLMHLQVHDEDNGFGLWLPLFLVWLLVLAVLLVLSPVLLIAALILWAYGRGRWVVGIPAAACAVLCSLHGLKVDIQNKERHVYVSVL